MNNRLSRPVVVLQSFSEEGSSRVCSKQKSLKGRLILSNERADFIAAFYSTDRPDKTDNFEFIEFDYQEAEWNFHNIEVPTGEVLTNQQSCSNCHGFPLRPITQEYNRWKIWLGMIHPQRLGTDSSNQIVQYDQYTQKILDFEVGLLKKQGDKVFKSPPFSWLTVFKDMDLSNPQKVVEDFQQNNTDFTKSVKALQSYKIYRDVIAELPLQEGKLPFDLLYHFALYAEDGGIDDINKGIGAYDPIELENRVLEQYQSIFDHSSDQSLQILSIANQCALKQLNSVRKAIKTYTSIDIPLEMFPLVKQRFGRAKNPPFFWKPVIEPLSFFSIAGSFGQSPLDMFTGNIKDQNDCVWRAGTESLNKFWNVGNYFLFHVLNGEKAPFEIPTSFGEMLPPHITQSERESFFEQFIGGPKRLKGAIPDSNTYKGFRDLVFAAHPERFY